MIEDIGGLTLSIPKRSSTKMAMDAVMKDELDNKWNHIRALIDELEQLDRGYRTAVKVFENRHRELETAVIKAIKQISTQ